MGIIEKIVVSDQAMRKLRERARDHGTTVEEEAANRLESELGRPSREEMLTRLQQFRQSLPPQSADALTLLREDRNR